MTTRTRSTRKRELVPPELLSGKVNPSESWHAARFVAWLERQLEAGRIRLFSHIANERRGPRERLNAWKLGTRAGVPDYCIVLPDSRVVWVELKRKQRGYVTKAQREWLEALRPHAVIAQGSDEAITFVSRYFGGSG